MSYDRALPKPAALHYAPPKTTTVNHGISSSGESKILHESDMQFCLCRPNPKIPRPRNAFILYRQHHQAAVIVDNPSFVNISKVLGEKWRRLPEEIKDEWKALAEQEKARHKQQYPEYRFQPRRHVRDGHSQSISSRISYIPPGSTVCSSCGSRVLNQPAIQEAPCTPGIQSNTVRATRPRQPLLEENGGPSPDSKRRRINPPGVFKPSCCGEKSPDMQMLQPPRPYKHTKDYNKPDPSLKLKPLQTRGPLSGDGIAITPFHPDNLIRSEARVMIIPILHKIKFLTQISPPLVPPFFDRALKRRGPVIAVDGTDSAAVTIMVDYLNHILQMEGRYHTRIFRGPKVRQRESYSAMGEAVVECLNRISVWHRISHEIVTFIKASTECPKTKQAEYIDGRLSEKSLKDMLSKAADVQTRSPGSFSESRLAPASSSLGTAFHPVPVAIVPQYQLTTADSFACSVPMDDTYAPQDHWQWMASLWRACVGPDITVYIRKCEKDETERFAGSLVETCLQDARTIVVRNGAGSRELRERAMNRVAFKIKDYLAQ